MYLTVSPWRVHELWNFVPRESQLRAVARYEQLVELCRNRNVLCTEDPYVFWGAEENRCLLALSYYL